MSPSWIHDHIGNCKHTDIYNKPTVNRPKKNRFWTISFFNILTISTPNPHPDLNLNSQQVDFQQPAYIYYQTTFPLAIHSTSTSPTILIVSPLRVYHVASQHRHDHKYANCCTSLHLISKIMLAVQVTL